MSTSNINYWKRLWRWTTSGSLTSQEIELVLGNKDVVEGLKRGLASYNPHKAQDFQQLQSKYSDQTKLLSVVQTLQYYIDVDCFQIWEIIKNYLCDISYGTPANALKNIAFVDTRPTFLLPNIWTFYYSERLFLLKLLQYIIQFKNDLNNKYNEQFKKIINDIGIQDIKTSLLSQFEKLLNATPPPRKIQSDFCNENIRQEWAECNLREQLAVLQNLLLIAEELSFSETEFNKLILLFRKHAFGKNQGYHEFLEERHRESCMRIMYMEICVFIVIVDSKKIKSLTSWIDSTKETVENELTKLHMNEEHSLLLISWMMLTLQSDKYAKLFESQYQHYGATALRMKVFEFMQQMLNSSVFSDQSECALIVRRRVFNILNELCDKFDGDGTLSHQPGVMQLCGQLLASQEIADEFWRLHQQEQNYGVVSLWNTALEYFPFNFSALSVLAAGLAESGKCSVRNLIAELKSLPVYTEIYNPNEVPVMSLQGDDAVIGKEYYPLGDPSYRIGVGSNATIMERKGSTMIHFRTPYSYWTVFNSEVEKALDRKQHHQNNINQTLQRVFEGTKVLKFVLKTLVREKEIPKNLVGPSEGVFDVLIRFMRADTPPLPLLVECLEVCAALVPVFPKEIHLRLINTGLLPRIINQNLTHIEYANGESFDSAAVGSYLVTIEQPSGTYDFLGAYIDMLCAFHEISDNDRVIKEIILPGLILVLREVFPNVNGWRYSNMAVRRNTIQRCARFLTLVLQDTRTAVDSVTLKRTCVYSLFHTENALELLKIISVGNDQLERIILNETNWITGTGSQFISTIQRCVAILIFALRLKTIVAEAAEVTPLERLIFAQNKQMDALKVVPKVTGYINHAFNKSLPVLCCRLLKKFADGFQMSLFASLDMTAYQVRVMFLDRLRDEYETTELKIAILEFVATCVATQPGLTEAFFMMYHETSKAEVKTDDKNAIADKKSEADDSFAGILGYMADYLGTVKTDPKLLHSPLLACIMALFHALWKNNMQILVKKLRENPKFWEYLTSPLFSDIQPELKTYAQIFNVLGIELFVSREKIEPNLKEMLELFFDTNKKYLDKWIDYIFSFNGRSENVELVDKVPAWLGLLTSWKDFLTIFCKYLPINLNIAHKAKMVAPCLPGLLNELDDLKDGRLVVILAELYVIMLANWKDDCFDNRKASAKHMENLLTNIAIVYECLHPRAIRAVLSICTVAISSLDYEIKANSVTAQNIIRSVTNINSLELEKLLDDIKDDNKPEPKQNGRTDNEDIAPVVLSLAMLEQCLDLYDDMFSGLSQWFQSSRFINKLLCCLQSCVQNRRHYHTSLAALRCLTAYSRGPFSKDLLMSDVDQFLWLQLLPPKFEDGSMSWKPHEWWRVYAYSLDFISMMVMKHGQFFASDAITFVGVHLEHLIEAVLLPRQAFNMDALNLCASTMNLIVQLVKFEARWRIQNINSLIGIMRSISACLYQCVTRMMRSRRTIEPMLHSTDESATPSPNVLHRTLEVLHMATLCLLSFSPNLLSLLADPGLDLERWQPLVELHFGAPKISYEPFPQLTFGTLVSAICLLTKSLNHAYHSEEGGGSRSPRLRRRACSCSSPGESKRANRSESLTSISSATSLPALDERLVAGALEATTTLLASQALLAVRDPNVPARDKQLVRRELSSELAVFDDFVRKRILCAAHAHPHLVRNKLGAWPLAANEEETKRIEEARKERNLYTCEIEDERSLPPPPPPKRTSNDSMREYILRKQYLDKCAQTPTKGPPSPVSHSTPTSDKKKETSRSSKRVSWAETTRDSDENLDSSLQEIEPVYSNLTDVQINNDEDYFHFMSVVFLYICQTEL